MERGHGSGRTSFVAGEASDEHVQQTQAVQGYCDLEVWLLLENFEVGYEHPADSR